MLKDYGSHEKNLYAQESVVQSMNSDILLHFE